MLHAVDTGDLKPMSLLLTIVSTLSASMWVVFGYLNKSIPVTMAYDINLLIYALQMVLHLQVLYTGELKLMPLFSAMVSTLSASLWVVFGYLNTSVSVMIAYGINLLIYALQMVLHVVDTGDLKPMSLLSAIVSMLSASLWVVFGYLDKSVPVTGGSIAT
ncbi:hypothetical protein ACFE04_020459 [Oxalis oulophora]